MRRCSSPLRPARRRRSRCPRQSLEQSVLGADIQDVYWCRWGRCGGWGWHRWGYWHPWRRWGWYHPYYYRPYLPPLAPLLVGAMGIPLPLVLTSGEVARCLQPLKRGPKGSGVENRTRANRMHCHRNPYPPVNRTFPRACEARALGAPYNPAAPGCSRTPRLFFACSDLITTC